VLQQKLAQSGIYLRGAQESPHAMIQINETINRRTPEEIAAEF
jgi:hypothetical protein